jgi:hypothetical protein
MKSRLIRKIPLRLDQAKRELERRGDPFVWVWAPTKSGHGDSEAASEDLSYASQDGDGACQGS